MEGLSKAIPVLEGFPKVPRALKMLEKLQNIKMLLQQAKLEKEQETNTPSEPLSAELDNALLLGFQSLFQNLAVADSLQQSGQYT